MPGGGRLVRRLERVVRDVAGGLEPPRDEALVTAAEATYTLLTGRRPGAGLSAHAEPRINRVAFKLATSALDHGDLEVARQRVEALVSAHPDSLRVLRLRRDILSRQGDLSEQARTLHRIHVLSGKAEPLDIERTLLGRIIETSPGWRPRIAGPPRPVPPAEGSVLHLMKESLPYLTNGFTMRSHYDLKAQRDAGMQPTVVTELGFPRNIGERTFPLVSEIDGIPHHRLDLGSGYLVERPFDLKLIDQAWLTARLARTIAPSVIHASSGHRGYESALVGVALREHLRRPLIYEVRSFFEASWSADADWNEQGEQYARRYETETRMMVAADHVITIAEAMRDDIVGRGVDPERVSVIPNGVDVELFRPRAASPELRRRYGLDGRFTIGYISNLDHPRENQELLVEATARLLARHRPVTCLIVGDGKRRDEIERIAKRAGVGDRVIFTGRVAHAEIQGYYALLDAFVVPRRDERAARSVTPLKPYEAMAMELPLVVADLPALVEIAAPDERGLAFRADDADALAATVERLIDDPDLGRRMGRAGREWVGRERTWAANGPRFRTVYDAVLERWAADPPAAEA